MTKTSHQTPGPKISPKKGPLTPTGAYPPLCFSSFFIYQPPSPSPHMLISLSPRCFVLPFPLLLFMLLPVLISKDVCSLSSLPFLACGPSPIILAPLSTAGCFLFYCHTQGSTNIYCHDQLCCSLSTLSAACQRLGT